MLLIDSTPPAITTSAAPVCTVIAAVMTACNPHRNGDRSAGPARQPGDPRVAQPNARCTALPSWRTTAQTRRPRCGRDRRRYVAPSPPPPSLPDLRRAAAAGYLRTCRPRCEPGQRSLRASFVTAPAVCGRIEELSQFACGEPDDGLQFEGVQVAHAPGAEIFQTQTWRVSLVVDVDRHLGELAVDHRADAGHVDGCSPTELDGHQIRNPMVGMGLSLSTRTTFL